MLPLNAVRPTLESTEEAGAETSRGPLRRTVFSRRGGPGHGANVEGVTVDLLGPLRVTAGGAGPAAIGAEKGTASQAINVVQQLVSALRRRLPGGIISTRGRGYQLQGPPAVDYARFTQTVLSAAESQRIGVCCNAGAYAPI